ncbi:AsmA family protein [Paludibaculum fermentans]|uniref:AsmA-like C-terminal domain-containing protein n=1 Tax=Paludibaculum fermentans TaxID=1473598 RepID=A0A7S7SK21_PALFE|nr:hypothetical protein [Paludibaculum fermentans]QOY87323.1 hypothetical protein IRI77_31925 [Paludibaculum fermentans]
MSRRTKWIVGSAVAAGLILAGLFVAGMILSRRFEPFLREQTIAYLETRFRASVALKTIHIDLPLKSPLDLLFHKGKMIKVRVNGEDLEVRLKSMPAAPSILKMRKFLFEVDLDAILNGKALVHRVNLEGFEINIPPKADRPKLANSLQAPEPQDEAGKPQKVDVLIEEVLASGSTLTILPKDATKAPLVFRIHTLRLESAGTGTAMKYQAQLTNAKPPGLIQCTGTFGPWVADSPSDTPLTGKYTFDNADLGVFKGIAGLLYSTGDFSGTLDEITVDGETRVPEFRLTMSGNRLPLTTKYHAIVDGTNGNTRLEPVQGVLGSTAFTVRGSVVRNVGAKGKTVDLKAVMPKGRLQDVLMLAMKGDKPFMKGGINLDFRVVLPPGQGEIADRLRLKGAFQLVDALFSRADVQEGLDSLSRRAQGQPQNEELGEIPSQMSGEFEMGGGRIDFSKLGFEIPGAEVELTGNYVFHSQELDFHGTARMQARLSQMMKSRWKRLALKPVDPFFAKDGYGVVAKIKITGTREKPSFGLDRGKK